MEDPWDITLATKTLAIGERVRDGVSIEVKKDTSSL